MTKTTTRVFVTTRTVGESFGTVAQIRSERTRRILAETRVRPYGFTQAALRDADAICEERGYYDVGCQVG